MRANDKEPMDRDIAMVFQNYALYPHMSVRQNMGYGLKIAGLPKDEIKPRSSRPRKLLQLEALLDRKPKQLSGGQRQRSRWAVRLCANRRCSCLMNHFRTLTQTARSDAP